MTDNEYRELAQRLKHCATTAANDDRSRSMTPERTRHVERYETMLDAADAILTLLAERPPREPEGERPRVDAAPPAEPTPDPDCVCSGNWRTLVKEYEPLIGKHFRDRHTGEVYTFYGLVHSDDDFYYGLSGGKEGKGRLDSCVGSLEHFYEQVDAAPAALTPAPPAEQTNEPVILEVKRGRFCPHCNPCLHDDDCLRPSEIAKRAADDGVRGFPHAAPAAEPVAQQPAPTLADYERCTYCGGNDLDVPCAYPSEQKPGCMRDMRLQQPEAPPTQDDDLVARLRRYASQVGPDDCSLKLKAAERIRSLEAEIEQMTASLDANWVQHQRVVKAERELAASREREQSLAALLQAVLDDCLVRGKVTNGPNRALVESITRALATPDSAAAPTGEAK